MIRRRRAPSGAWWPGRCRCLERLAAYEPGLMATLARRATRGRHVNVMEHLAGFASDQLDPQDKVELAGVIDAFRQGHVPLEVPLTLLRHHTCAARASRGRWPRSTCSPSPRRAGACAAPSSRSAYPPAPSVPVKRAGATAPPVARSPGGAEARHLRGESGERSAHEGDVSSSR
ncbi:MAG: YbgA family protein [bacterium]